MKLSSESLGMQSPPYGSTEVDRDFTEHVNLTHLTLDHENDHFLESLHDIRNSVALVKGESCMVVVVSTTVKTIYQHLTLSDLEKVRGLAYCKNQNVDVKTILVEKLGL